MGVYNLQALVEAWVEANAAVRHQEVTREALLFFIG